MFHFTFINKRLMHTLLGVRGGVVVKALRYKPVAGSIPDGVIGIFHGPGVDSASNRNEYQVYFLGVKAAGA
jgi:hypothetical protein